MNKDFANAKRILECMQKAGASDSLTITNYAAALLNEMMDKNKIVLKTLTQAKDLTFKAVKLDAPRKGRTDRRST